MGLNNSYNAYFKAVFDNLSSLFLTEFTLSDSDFKFCVVAHDYEDLYWVLKTWPKATIIQFQNERNFIKKYRSGSEWDIPEYLDIFWQNIRGAEWPEHAPTNLTLYKQLPKFIQNEITKVHGNEILKHYAELDSCEAIDKKLIDINTQLNGDATLAKREFETSPAISGRIGSIEYTLV